ncbi:ribonuclease D [Thalassomonas viridans]|uniref:Ribonuclease D n=1 Tax=Thalassomonas viridans TaxID=137584 RepID=A0AAF0C9H4_9GAMM|nr:ribonuclease D [Thalassomonas viridans]WDE07512.1 ribonuclease D [Thalassomonas viridans]
MQENQLQQHYIEDFTALTDLCRQLSSSKVLAVDTEFVRTRTLYPKLGLLQVCNGEHLALIDPVAIEDLSPFWQLLTNADIVKVLHACSEDLEVFLCAANCKPVNLIDSQIMMSFLGQGLSMGYAAMIQQYTGVELDKSESRTDWTKRPLSPRQLSYAQADVLHLYRVYPQILQQLEDSGWLEAACEETRQLIERKFTPVDEDTLYRNIKMSWRLNARQLNNLKYLARWRYQRAKVRDLPLGFIAKDDTLMALSQRAPKSVGAMAHIEGIDVLDIRHQGKAMLAVLKQADAVSEEDYPDKIVRLDEYPGYKQIFKKVKNFISDVAKTSNLAAENLASKKQINQFLSWYFKINGAGQDVVAVDILQSWRFELFGEKLQAFAENGFGEPK